MSSTAAPRSGSRLPVLVGALLLVPRLVLAWFVGLDVLQFVSSFLLIAGVVVLGVVLFRMLRSRRPGMRGWPLGVVGIAAVLVAGLLTPLLRNDPVPYSGGFVPAPVVLFQYGWTLVGAVWVLGIVFVLGAVAARRRR